MKKCKQFFYIVLVLFLLFFCHVVTAGAQLCNSDNYNMCMEVLDEDGTPIDQDSIYSNTRSASMRYDVISYGKALLKNFTLHNSGNTGVLGIGSNPAQYFLWSYLNLEPDEFVSTPTDFIWSVYSYSGLLIPSGDEKKIDILFAPVPGHELSGTQTYSFRLWPYDSKISVMKFNVTLSGDVQGSTGKKYDVNVIDNNGSSEIEIKPDIDTVGALGDNEYLLAYFEIDQIDGNPYKEIVVLQKDESPNVSLNGGEADKSGTSAAYSHKEFDNGNILLRSRDTKYETKTKYWLLFKSVDAIFLKCYKKTVPVSPDIADTSGTAEADLKFVYADEVVDDNGEFPPKEELVRVKAGEEVGNSMPNTPYSPYPGYKDILEDTGSVTLSWTGGDPDGDPVIYSVYFSNNESTLTNDANKHEVSAPTHIVTGLGAGTYYWKVVATDSSQATVSSSVWQFTIEQSTEPPMAEFVEFYLSGVKIKDNRIVLQKGQKADLEMHIDPQYIPQYQRLTFNTETNPTLSLATIQPETLKFSANVTVGLIEIKADDTTKIQDPVVISFVPDPQGIAEYNGYSITVAGNTEPDKPVYTLPVNNDTITTKSIDLTWTCKDSDGDDLTYEVKLGKSEAELKTVNTEDEAITEDSFSLTNLEDDTEYFWQIVVKDSFGAETEGDTWSFTVNNNEFPGKPESSMPENNVITALVTDLTWTCTDPDDGDTLTYKVTYGLSQINNDTVLVESTQNTMISFTDLKENTTYFWKVAVNDGNGGKRVSDIFTFTTGVPFPDAPDLKNVEIEELKPKPVCPTVADNLGQPLALGENPKEHIQEILTLSYSYPAYGSEVDIYIMVQYNDALIFISQDANNSPVYGTDMKPYIKNSTSAENGSIVLYDAGVLRDLGLSGKFVFWSGVMPAYDPSDIGDVDDSVDAGDTDSSESYQKSTFDVYDIVYFTLPIDSTIPELNVPE